ncbi:MAG TPA: hypothetical protein VD816_19380 [Ohtaekwangia sp.]|nr:hypothetical protein [Ohtaekwangia sp.]
MYAAYSAFFFAVLFGFAGASATVPSSVAFFVVDLFSRALMVSLFLETP